MATSESGVWAQCRRCGVCYIEGEPHECEVWWFVPDESESEATKPTCSDCRDWHQVRLQDSGIRAARGSGNWFYWVGDCRTESGAPEAARCGGVPEWYLACTAFRRKRASARAKGGGR